MHDHTKQIVLLGILVVVIAILAFVLLDRHTSAPSTVPAQLQNTSQLGPNGVRIPPPEPTLTASDTVAVQNMQPFQLLVSYVNTGFEPADATIKAGETVRFTNNSTGELWVAASGDKLYPAIENGCGSSALDSCGPLEPGQFWQFTFTKSGTWNFQNNLNKSKAGSITITVQ